MRFSLIVAVQKDTNVIASNNKIPWYNTQDLQMFKKLTTYTGISDKPNILIVGYNTFITLPNLKDRIIIVLTKSHIDEVKNAYACSSWEDIFKLIKTLNYTNIFVCGGKALYEYALNHPYFYELFLTVIDNNEKYENTISIDLNLDNLKLVQSNGMFYHYKNKYEPFEIQYMNILNEIMTNGIEMNTRNAITKSINNVSIKIDLNQGFPIPTLRKIYWKGIVHELIWFISGNTSIKYLQDNGINIWNGNTTREFLDKRGLTNLPIGDIGKSYGYQFRKLKIDQLQECINLIKNDPSSRRILINLWNVEDLDQMALPPCCYSYQFLVENGKLNLNLIQRSFDCAVAWNISTGSLLTHILAKMCDLQVGTVLYTIGNCHVYQQHYEAVKELLSRHPKQLPKLNIKIRRDKIEDYVFDDFELINYNPNPAIKMEMVA
jgi:thymidylate synthase